ncbi:MAG: GNAT family N-acetyltransferase [Cyanobacteria bacterium HKST-UBA02]|nr:GNAT family N-acetyltransferase [Cyanobacteria bacterium HKST-UBA02]
MNKLSVIPVLDSERLYLRPVSIADVSDRYCAWLNDREVNQFLETRFSEQTLESIREFVASKVNLDEEPFFAICLKDGDRHIGNIKLGPISRYHNHADISLFIGERDQWGKGFASEAIAAITKYAFDERGLNKLRAGCYARNHGSARAFEKCGYVREGLLKGYLFEDDGETDMILLGLHVSDYRRLKK